MRKIILATIVTALLLCVASCALADTAKVVEVKTGVTKINSADWAEKFPDVYASYMATEENKDVIDHVAEYPMIATVYEGMAFNTYYGSARGHFYCVEDVQATGRPHKLANCWTCKTADYTHMVNEMGDEAYSIPFEDALQNINESMGCYKRRQHRDPPVPGQRHGR